MLCSWIGEWQWDARSLSNNGFYFLLLNWPMTWQNVDRVLYHVGASNQPIQKQLWPGKRILGWAGKLALGWEVGWTLYWRRRGKKKEKKGRRDFREDGGGRSVDMKEEDNREGVSRELKRCLHKKYSSGKSLFTKAADFVNGSRTEFDPHPTHLFWSK